MLHLFRPEYLGLGKMTEINVRRRYNLNTFQRFYANLRMHFNCINFSITIRYFSYPLYDNYMCSELLNKLIFNS